MLGNFGPIDLVKSAVTDELHLELAAAACSSTLEFLPKF
jgi:hypothetical protein